RFEAIALSLRDVLAERWIHTQTCYDNANPKRVYYLSMEFLIGRALVNNIINLGIEPAIRDAVQTDPRHDWKEMVEAEPDAGLGNGHLRADPRHESHLLAVPYDRPVVGYGGRTVNTLRLWGAASPEFFHFGEFSSGDFVGAIVDRTLAETVTRVLYPDDSTTA